MHTRMKALIAASLAVTFVGLLLAGCSSDPPPVEKKPGENAAPDPHRVKKGD